MHAIRMERVEKAYGTRPVLKGLTLNVEPGTVYALVGGASSGKSTAVRLIVGLTPADAGRVEVGGADPWLAKPAHHGRVGYVSAARTPYPWMTVAETLAFHAGLYLTWDEVLAAELVARLGLDPGRRAGELEPRGVASLGLICGIGFRPQLIVLDEPASRMEPAERPAFLAQLAIVVREVRATALITSADLSEAAPVAERAALLEDGRVALELNRSQLTAGRVLFSPSPKSHEEEDGAKACGTLLLV